MISIIDKSIYMKTIHGMSFLAFLSLTPALERPAAAGVWTAELIGGGTVSFLGVGGRHTWSDAFGSSTCAGDITQSWHSGVGHCTRYGGSWNATSCAYAYNVWNYDEDSENHSVSSCADVKSRYANHFAADVPGVYLYNGVCHQASNRALKATSIQWVHKLPISGGTTSYLAFANCGSFSPYGLPFLTCPL